MKEKEVLVYPVNFNSFFLNFQEIPNQNSGSYTEEIQNSIVFIQSFIDERKVNVKKDIDRIAKFISEKKDQELCSYLKKIAAIIPC